jgi:hypothetical protein
VTRSPGVHYPICYTRRIEGHGAEVTRKGLLIPRSRPRCPRCSLRSRDHGGLLLCSELVLNRPVLWRHERAVDELRKMAWQGHVLAWGSEESLLGCGLVCGRARLLPTALLHRPTCGAGPHCDLPGPRIIQQRPGHRGLSSATAIAATPSAATTRGAAAAARAARVAAAGRRGSGGTARGRRGAPKGGDAGGGRSAGGLWRGGDEGGRWCRRLRTGVDLLEDEVVADVVEGGEWLGALEVDLHVGELLVQTAQHIEDEGAVMDDLAEITKSLSHPLHLAAIVADRKIDLHKNTELGIEAKGASFAIAKELLLNGDPGAACCATKGADGLHQLGGERAQHPRQDNGIHAPPRWRGGGGVGEDMVGEGVPLESEQDEVAPAIVVGEEGVQNDGHKGTKVLDARRLRVKVGDGGNLVVGVVGRRWEGGVASSDRGVLEISGGLVFPCKGFLGGANTILGGSGGLSSLIGGGDQGLASRLLCGRVLGGLSTWSGWRITSGHGAAASGRERRQGRISGSELSQDGDSLVIP